MIVKTAMQRRKVQAEDNIATLKRGPWFPQWSRAMSAFAEPMALEAS